MIITLGLAGASASGCSSSSATSEETTPEVDERAAPEPQAAPVDEEPASTPQPRPQTPTPEVDAPEPYEVVSRLRGLDGWTIVPLAHFRRGERHALILWPAINSSGRLVDATVVGVALEPDAAGNLVERGRRWVVPDEATSRAALVAALGGEDYEVLDRRLGVSLDQLGPRLSSLSVAFGRFVSAGARVDAKDAAVAFSRLLPLERAAFEPSVARLLWMASAHSARLEHVETLREGETATLTFRVMRGGMTFQTITATATQLEGHPGRWVVSSYRE